MEAEYIAWQGEAYEGGSFCPKNAGRPARKSVGRKVDSGSPRQFPQEKEHGCDQYACEAGVDDHWQPPVPVQAGCCRQNAAGKRTG
jgi:hypothetical protein